MNLLSQQISHLFKKIWRPVLALTLLVILAIKGPFQLEQLKSTLKNPGIIFLGISLFFLQILISSLRWKLFINLVTEVKLFNAFKLTLIGSFFNHFIPGGVGGDIVKALELSKNNNCSRAQALTSVLSDRVFGLFAMISFTFIFLLIEYIFYQEAYIIKFLILSGALLLIILLFLLFLPGMLIKFSTHLSTKSSGLLIKLEKLVTTLHFTFITFKNFRIQVKSFFISLALQLLSVYFMFEVVRSLNIPLPSFLIFFSLCCFSFVASAIPIFPAGIGVGQAAIYVLFSNVNEDLAKATIIAITTMQIFNLFYALIGGAIFSFMPKIKKETLEALI